MKKILFACLMSIHLFTFAGPRLQSLICKEHGWYEHVSFFINERGTADSGFVCILPNGKYYNSWYLTNSFEGLFLIEQYSGQYPTFEQIEKAKEQMRKDGLILD